MLIRHKIFLIAGVSFLLSGLLLLTVLYSSSRIQDAQQEHTFAHTLNDAVTNLDTITYEYLMYHEDRMHDQWQIVYAKALNDLETYRTKSEQDELEQFAGLSPKFEQLREIFMQLTARSQNGDRPELPGITSDDLRGGDLLEARLVSQLLMISNDIKKITEDMAENAYAEVQGLLQLSYWIIAGGAVFLALVITGLCLLIVKSISQPLAKLLEGIRRIGQGELTHTIPVTSKDEVGDLAAAFNRMTSSLSTVTASRDELNAEIAERNKAQAELAREKALTDYIIDSLPGVFYLFDEQGVMHRWNRNLEKVIGYTHEEIANMSPLDMFTGQDREHIYQAIHQVFVDGRGEAEASYCTRDGRLIPHAFTGVRVEVDGKPMLIGVGIDITGRKQMEQRLEAANLELQRSNQELEQFAYVASHDLQEPLRMVSSYTQLLEKRYKDQLDDSARTFIHYAVDGATRMQGLINDLLAYSRIATKGNEFKLLSSQRAFESALANMQGLIDEIQAEVTNDPLPEIVGDFGQLARVFQNLLSNALKYRKKEITPRIHVSAEDEDTEWRFSVQDNSIGMDPQYANRIFQIFKRLHTAREYPGTGMGLSLCKRIIERHGGRIWVESEPNVGSTFFFTIPKQSA